MERFSCGNNHCRTCNDSPAVQLGDKIRHLTSQYTLHRRRLWNSITGNVEARAEVLNMDAVIREIEGSVEAFMRQPEVSPKKDT